MVVPLLSLLLAAAPSTPQAEPSLAGILASLLDGWSIGYTASAGGTAGRTGFHPAVSLGVASTVFDGAAVDGHLAAELGGQISAAPELELRLKVGGRPVALGPCTLGVVSSGALRWTDGWAGTARVGPELSAHFRVGGTHHVLMPFLRYEWALLERARFEDRATLGVQFLLSE